MDRLDLFAILPLLGVSATSLVALMAIAVRRSHAWTAGLTVAGLFATAFFFMPVAALVAPRQVTRLYSIDPFAIFYFGVLLAAGVVVALLAYSYFARLRGAREEFYVLLLLAVFGAMSLGASSHLASLFVSLEIVSVALFALVAYQHDRDACLEAGIKYLVLAGAASAFLIFGAALVYAEFGTMDFAQLAMRLADAGVVPGPLFTLGAAMILVALGFKLAVAPFHIWTPDVYQGAPAPATALIATVSKAAVVAVALRFFAVAGLAPGTRLWWLIAVMAALSMLGGNLLALRQTSLKRLLAYSSIAHMGYLLVAVLAGGALAGQAATFYVVTYVLASLASFGVIASLADESGEPDDLADYTGLVWRRPAAGLVLFAALLSLAGIPLTVGFVGKFFLLTAGLKAALWAPVLVLIAASVIGVFYYLRVIVAIFATPEADGAPAPRALPVFPLIGGIGLAAATIGLVWFGVDPEPLLAAIRAAILI